jgi:phosphoserine phosphatase RsbU/P
MPELVLELLSGPELPARQWPLALGLVLGRSAECALVLPDAGVSRRHAAIEERGGQLCLRDLGSRAGTYLNDRAVDPLRPASIAEHDRIRIGPWRFRVRRDETPAARSLPGAVSQGSVTQIATPLLAAERRLELLVEFAATTASADDAALISLHLADFARRGTNARTSTVWVAVEDGWILAAAQPEGISAPPLPAEVLEAARAGGVVQADVALPGESAARALLAVALRVDKEVRALLLVELATPDRRQRADGAEFAHALARLAGLTLGNFERRDIERRHERLAADLEQARDVQRRILPVQQGLAAGTRYALHVHPGRLVAGDLVDVFAVDERHCAVILGDVAGAGVGAGFLMASVQAYLHAELLETGDPATAARRCNRYVSRVGGGRFATAWIGIVDSVARRIRYVDAGHGLGTRITVGGDSRPLGGRGSIPLGIDAGAGFEAEDLDLAHGERVVLYSDGVAEIRSPAGTAFAPEALAHSLTLGGHPEADVAAVMAELARFAGGALPSDDASILAFDLPVGGD